MKLRHQKIAPFTSLLPDVTTTKSGGRESWRTMARRDLARMRTIICTVVILFVPTMLGFTLWMTSNAQGDPSLPTEPLTERYLNLMIGDQSAGLKKQPISASFARGHRHVAVTKQGSLALKDGKREVVPEDTGSKKHNDDSESGVTALHRDAATAVGVGQSSYQAVPHRMGARDTFRGDNESDAEEVSESNSVEDEASDESTENDSDDQEEEPASATTSTSAGSKDPAEKSDSEELGQAAGDSAAVVAASNQLFKTESGTDASDTKKPTIPTTTQAGGGKAGEVGGQSASGFVPRHGQRMADASEVPKTIHHSSIRNGTVYEVPASWSRFSVPWFVPHQTFKLKSVSEARNRILYAPTRHMMSDGIGHSMASLNYEIRVAQALGLAYSHRVSMYSSLSVNSPLAVEDFFGWGDGVPIKREQLMRQVCRSENKNDSKWAAGNFQRRFQCNTCASIRQGNMLGIDKLVDLPTQLCVNCVDGTRTIERCARERAEYIKSHNDSNTLFQLPVKYCAVVASDGQFDDTKHYFFHKYWERHAYPKPLSAMMKRGVQKRNATRTMKLIEHELNIAVHVRRGDFFKPEVRIKRKVFTDEVYAKLICRALQVAIEVGGVFAELPVRVHIFSEGQLVSRGISTHSVASQDQKYYDFNGVARDAGWWERLIAHTARQQLKDARLAVKARPGDEASLRWKDVASMESVLKRLSVRLRISEPTLASLHEMASADVFVGSMSGLSTNTIGALTRGVSLIPYGSAVKGGGSKNRICCTVSFDPDTFDFNATKLLQNWRAYTAANGKSARAAVAARRRKASTRE